MKCSTAGLAIGLGRQPTQDDVGHLPASSGHIPLRAHRPLEDDAEGELVRDVECPQRRDRHVDVDRSDVGAERSIGLAPRDDGAEQVDDGAVDRARNWRVRKRNLTGSSYHIGANAVPMRRNIAAGLRAGVRGSSDRLPRQGIASPRGAQASARVSPKRRWCSTGRRSFGTVFERREAARREHGALGHRRRPHPLGRQLARDPVEYFHRFLEVRHRADRPRIVAAELGRIDVFLMTSPSRRASAPKQKAMLLSARDAAIGFMRSAGQNNVSKTVRARILFVNGNFNEQWRRPRPVDSRGSLLDVGESAIGRP